MSERTTTVDVISARERDLGGFSVRRVLPSPHRRHVGPFVFLDHMGPLSLPPGHGMDVRPHPHIGLSTVTYLFEGEIVHRDSLGSHQTILPGDVNWMTAGRGIVHSERTGEERRKQGPKLHGLQWWVALSKEHEETAPAFVHYPKSTLPVVEDAGTVLRVVAGTAYGVTSPVKTLSPLFYVDVELPAGRRIEFPEGYEECAVYVVSGRIETNDVSVGPGEIAVLDASAARTLSATETSRVALIGGTSLGDREMYWNFVSTSPERIERAKAEWRERKFPLVPGDETEFTPLPEK